MWTYLANKAHSDSDSDRKCVCVCVYEGVEKTFVKFYDFLFYFACSEIQFFFSLPQGNVAQ